MKTSAFPVFVLAVLAATGFAAVELGIAQQYPFDAGLQNDSNVIFSDFFEQNDFYPDIGKTWDLQQYPASQAMSNDKPAALGGSRSLIMNGYGSLLAYLPEVDTVYMRVYAKFGSNCSQHHHWIWVGGQNPKMGNPGIAGATSPPPGDKYFFTAAEVWGGFGSAADKVWRWDFYTYWTGMKPDGAGQYWGNKFVQDLTLVPPQNEWFCAELMIRLNNPVTAKNGEQAFWINGEKKAHLGQGFPNGRWGAELGNWHTGWWFPGTTALDKPFEGYQWRTDSNLKINTIWLQNDIGAGEEGMDCSCNFDNVVLSKKYIGPAVGTGTAPADVLPPYATMQNPKPDQNYVLPATNVTATIKDQPAGIDKSSLVMKINNLVVTPTISGTVNAYTMVYDPPLDFVPGESVHVEITGRDLWPTPHLMKETYSFAIKPSSGMADRRELTVYGLRFTAEPGKGRVTFRMQQDGAYALNIFDLSGRKVWHHFGEGEAIWNHGGNLKKGVYLVRLEQDGIVRSMNYSLIW